MFITPHKALAHVDRLAGWKSGARPAPVTVEWDLSNACSLGCQSCHFAHTHMKGPWAGRARALPTGYSDTGTFADMAVVERGLDEMARCGVQAVIWSGGGEPTLHPHWQGVMRLAADSGLKQGMYTLGGHVSADEAAFLAAISAWVVVSLDASNATAYASEKGVNEYRFDAAARGAKALADAGGTVGASFLLHDMNWESAPSMLWLARALGVTYTTFRPTIDTSPAQPGTVTSNRGWITHAEPLLRKLAAEADVECDVERFLQYRDWTHHGYSACHGIKLGAAITPDGRVWVCPQRRGVAGSCLGDLRTESFETIWARHPGQWTDFTECRAMCRFHLMNQAIAPVFANYAHQEFV